MYKALIIDNNLVAQVADQEFEVAPPWYWVDCPDHVRAYEHIYINGEFVNKEDDTPSGDNKLTAQRLLNESDFAVLTDVNIVNKLEWIEYRAALRIILQNPPTGAVNWPRKPDSVWE